MLCSYILLHCTQNTRIYAVIQETLMFDSISSDFRGLRMLAGYHVVMHQVPIERHKTPAGLLSVSGWMGGKDPSAE